MGLPETNTAIDFYIGTLHFVNWRLFLIICSIPAFLSSVSILFLPESPAFLYLVRCFWMSLNCLNYYRISGNFRVIVFHVLIFRVIIESVDSICRDSVDTQYTAVQKISQNLKNSKLISFDNNVPFNFKCFHDQQDSQWREKASQRYQTNNLQNGPNVFLLLSSFFFLLSSFFFLLSSDGLAQYCMILSRWFTHETAAFCTERCTTPSLFSQLGSLARHS